MLALLAMLGSGALFGGGGAAAPAKPGGAPSPGDDRGGLLEGLGGLLDRFRQSGQGKTIDSWIGTGPNESVSPGQLGNALGPNVIKTLAERSGMSEEERNRGKFPGPLTLACHYDGAGRISSARCGIWAPGMPRRSPK